MPKIKQLTVTIQNRPGTLASVAGALGRAKINILAFLTTTSGAEGYLHIVVDDVNKAKNTLEEGRFSYAEQEVLYVELPNSAGALGRLSAKLAAKNLNITSAYATTVKASRKACVVLSLANLDEAARVLS